MDYKTSRVYDFIIYNIFTDGKVYILVKILIGSAYAVAGNNIRGIELRLLFLGGGYGGVLRGKDQGKSTHGHNGNNGEGEDRFREGKAAFIQFFTIFHKHRALFLRGRDSLHSTHFVRSSRNDCEDCHTAQFTIRYACHTERALASGVYPI